MGSNVDNFNNERNFLMTYEEEQQYNKLSYSGRMEYDHIKSMHPNWSHSQIMTKLSTDITIGKMIENGRDVDVDNPAILKEILEGAKSFLIGAGIFIAAVFEVIDDALDALGDLICRGISYIGDKLSEFWDWLTS